MIFLALTLFAGPLPPYPGAATKKMPEMTSISHKIFFCDLFKNPIENRYFGDFLSFFFAFF